MTCKQAIILIGLVLLVATLPLGFLTLAQFSAAGLLWLAGCALILTDIVEITMGKLAIKRDVRAARKIREQIGQQAEEIEAIRDQIAATEAMVAEQARSIKAASEKVAQSEDEVMQTRIPYRS